MSSGSRIKDIEAEMKKLQEERYALLEKDREDEKKKRKEDCLNRNKKAIDYLQQFLGKWCVFGSSPISHFYWDPFKDGRPISYDYVYIMFVKYIDFMGNSVAISGDSIYTSDHGIEIDTHFQRNFSLPYIDGSYKPSDHEQYRGGLRVLSDDEVAKAIEFAKKYTMAFIDNIANQKDPKTSFHTDLRHIYGLEEADAKKLEEEARELESWNQYVAIAYCEYRAAEEKFRTTISRDHGMRDSFTVMSKYLRSLNGCNIL